MAVATGEGVVDMVGVIFVVVSVGVVVLASGTVRVVAGEKLGATVADVEGAEPLSASATFFFAAGDVGLVKFG